MPAPTASARAPKAAAPQGRIPWIDTGRGIAILLVTLVHATNWLANGFHIGPWFTIEDTMASLRMPLFFALSGIFAPKWLQASWRDLLKSKVLLFVWVFLVWETVGSLVFQLGLVMEDKCCGVRDTAIDLILTPIIPQYELWFIWCLAIFFIVARATRSIDFRLQLVITGAIAFVALMGWNGINDGWEGALKYYFFFLGGLYLRKWIVAFGSTRSRLLLGGALAVWGAYSIALAVFGWSHFPGAYFVNSVIGVLGGVALSRFLTPVKFLGRIGQQTLPIYLSHTPIVLVISFLITRPFLIGIFTPIQAFLPPILVAVAVVVALWLHRLAQRTAARYLYEPPPGLVRLFVRRPAATPSSPVLGATRVASISDETP